MKLLALVALAASAVLAGCIDNANLTTGIEEASSDTPAGVLPWGATDCDIAIAVVPVPVEAVADRIPEGFTPVPPEALGLPDDPRGDAALGVETFQCASVTGLEREVTDGAYGSFFLFVEPPAELKEDVTYHFLKWDVLVADADLRAALATAGVPARDGSSGFGALPGTVDAGNTAGEKGALQARLVFGEDELYGFNGAATNDWTDALTGSFVEFTPTENGLVTWRTAFEWEALVTGAGYLKNAPGSWVEDATGGERVPAYFLWGRGSFTDGTVTLPAPAKLAEQ